MSSLPNPRIRLRVLPSVPARPNALEIGTVVDGVTASASIIGVAPNQVLNLVLPQGPAGVAGPAGPLGPTGASGVFSAIASQAEAQAGADNTKGMSPLRVKQAIIAQALVFMPLQFGAVGDGVTDDGAAINAMTAAVRTLLNANNQAPIHVDLTGTWRTTISLDFTNCTGWNTEISGGCILGQCTGKAVIDESGSRGLKFYNVGVSGDATDMPAIGFLQARSTAGARACDNGAHIGCSTTGWFSEAARKGFGFESTVSERNTWFNYCHSGYVAVYQGTNKLATTSDYATIQTTGGSFSNNKFIVDDYRYIPIATANLMSLGNSCGITGITKANPMVVSVNANIYAIGDAVVFSGIGGMTQLEGKRGVVTAKTSSTLTFAIDSSAYTTYTSGGSVLRAATRSAAIYIDTVTQIHFDTCYVVTYGNPHFNLHWPSNTPVSVYQDFELDVLCEGQGNPSNILFTSDANIAMTYNGFTHHSINVNADYMYDFTVNGTNSLALIRHDIVAASYYPGATVLGLCNNGGHVGIYAGELAFPADPVVSGLAAYSGRVTIFNTGQSYDVGIGGPALSTFAGVVATTGGALGTSASTIKHRKNNGRAEVDVEVNITTLSTATGPDLTTTMPYTNTGPRAVVIGEDFGLGILVMGYILNGSNVLHISKPDLSFAAHSGADIYLSFTYDIA